MLDVARYARQIALPEIGPEGQARISAARVAVVGADLTAETAATYLRAAGVGQVFEASELLSDLGAGEVLKKTIAQFDLVIRSGFDDAPMDGAAARLGHAGHLRAGDAGGGRHGLVLGAGPLARGERGCAVQGRRDDRRRTTARRLLAGTLAAAEALQAIVREAAGPFTPSVRHLRLPLDGREPLVQEIGQRR